MTNDLPALILMGTLVTTTAGASLLWLRARAQLKRAKRSVRLAAQEQQALASNLGHEITSSLNALLGAGTLATQEDGLSAEGRRNLDIIKGATRELQLTAFNLLAYHAGDDRRVAGERCRFILPDMLDDIVAAARPMIDARRMDLRLQCQVGSPYTLTADKHHLRILVANVLAHTMRATAAGHIDVTINAPDGVAASQNVLSMTITDTATQTPANLVAALFEPYGGRNQRERGEVPQTGLNLAVARELARGMGGNLTYRATSDGRNSYEITVPTLVDSLVALPPAPSQVVVSMDTLFAMHRRTIEPQQVLVVEDQRSNAHLIESILRKAGHAVTMAESGELAMRYLRDREFDAAFIDLRLPGMGGVELIREATRSGHIHHTAFVVLTSEDDESVREACARAGAQVFLSKPISAQRLLESLQVVVTRRAQTADNAITAANSAHTRQGDATTLAEMQQRLEGAQQALSAGDMAKLRETFRALRGLAVRLSDTALMAACTEGLQTSEATLHTEQHTWAARIARWARKYQLKLEGGQHAEEKTS